MKKKRIALIGLGMAVSPHAKSLIDLADAVEVVRAISPSPQRRQAFARHFGFPVGDSLEPVLADPSIDAAAVLTPPNTHLEIATRLAHAGKHILLEKPLEVTSARAAQLVATCAAAGVSLGVVLQHRFKPAAERLAAILAAGGLGPIVNASTSIRLWRPQTYYEEPGRGSLARDGGGVLLTQGIHTLDLLLSLAGPAAEVCGYATTSAVHRMETEDLVCAAVRFQSGALGVIEATTAAYPGAPERIELIGSEATAVLTGTALAVAYHDGRHEALAADASAGGTGADPMAFPHDYHLAVWRDFLAALDAQRPPRVSGSEALKVHLLIDALLAAGRSDRKVKVRSTA
jgi:UDP-N-acetyl-2-amino-2-deoxyglucuronate dehydrogenase